MTTGQSDTTNIRERQKSYFVGVPLSVTYTLTRPGRLRLYATAGAGIDVPVRISSVTDYNIDNHIFYSKKSHPEMPQVQWSVNAGAGIGYELLPHVELFFSPRVTYYLPAGGNTPTLWQDKPLQIQWPLGIRLKY